MLGLIWVSSKVGENGIDKETFQGNFFQFFNHIGVTIAKESLQIQYFKAEAKARVSSNTCFLEDGVTCVFVWDKIIFS